MLPKAINRLTAIPIKIPSTLFRARNSNPKIYMESQKKQIAKAISSKTNNREALSIPLASKYITKL
jgi:hypothetical protein